VVVVLALCGVLGFGALVVALLNGETPDGGLPPLATALWGDAYLLLGGLVLWQRPTLVMPRLMLAVGALLALTTFSSLVSVSPGSTPRWSDAIGVSLFLGLGAAVGILVHLFPNGQAPAPGWGWAVRLLVVSSLGLIGGQLLHVDPRDGGLLVKVVAVTLSLGYAVGLLSALPSLGYRVWQSRGLERAQLKWFLAAVVLSLGWFTSTVIGTLVAAVLPPLAIAFALTRYRLYDIDRIISRTASYAIVTTALLATYALLVTQVPNLVPVSSSLAVAAATLTAAALARPLFRRVQSLVDRRFNRAHYDAQQTIDAFGTRLRRQVDTDVVNRDLVAVVHDSLQPEQIALWVRGA
jgi:hypothetical protein